MSASSYPHFTAYLQGPLQGFTAEQAADAVENAHNTSPEALAERERTIGDWVAEDPENNHAEDFNFGEVPEL